MAGGNRGNFKEVAKLVDVPNHNEAVMIGKVTIDSGYIIQGNIADLAQVTENCANLVAFCEVYDYAVAKMAIDWGDYS